jgi:hypothetical protein
MIYFVHIKHPDGYYYPSYNDYFRLVHLSGFDECDLEEVDPQSSNTYIFTLNYHGIDQGPIPDVYLMPGKRSARMILHQLERYNIVDERFDEIWVYDQSLMIHPKCKYVFVGGHRDFCIPRRTATKAYDFYHMAYLYGERLRKVELISHYRIAPAPYEFEAKNFLLQSSKVGLCLHQDNRLLIEPIRYTVFSCYKLPLLAERSLPNEYMTYSFSEFIEGEFQLNDMREHNYELVMTKDFKSQILEALK